MKRSNVIVSIGIAVFIIGAATTYLLVKNDDDSTTTTAGGGTTVLYADKDIPAGTTGNTAVEQKMVKTKNVATKPAGALTDISELGNRTASINVAKGQTLTSAQFTTSQTAIGTLKIPVGKTAIALQMSNVPGVAGFVGAGDKVNVYGLMKDAENDQFGVGKLVLQNVEVLNVNGGTLVSSQGQPGGTGLIFLVAVDPIQAEHLAYLTTFGQLYFALVEKDSRPVESIPSTPGRTAENALEQTS